MTRQVSGMDPRRRAQVFCERFGLRCPIVQAPMAGACPPGLAVAVAQAGGMGACGVLLDAPQDIAHWVHQFRAGSTGPLQLNIWIPDPPRDDQELIDAAAAFLGSFGSPGESVGAPAVFEDQCEAMLDAQPTVISSIMGVFEPDFVRRMRERGISWFACATTLDEALTAQEAGADAIVAQGTEAGGHRGSFDPIASDRTQVGLFALLPWFADHLEVPIVAAGGIGDGRGVAAALALGASAVQVGTAFLRTPEAAVDKGWSDSLKNLAPDSTALTRAYSGRLGRAVSTAYVQAWTQPETPAPAPYPHQRRLVARWRRGTADGVDRVNQWAGQSAALATTEPAAAVVTRMWRDGSAILARQDTQA
jgi:nitronate monooxygenase